MDEAFQEYVDNWLIEDDEKSDEYGPEAEDVDDGSLSNDLKGRVRTWCVTINNPRPSDLHRFSEGSTKSFVRTPTCQN